MAEEESRFYWPQGWSRLPDGVSVSTPTFPVIGGIGGTYYLNPGASSAPRVTVTKRTGMGGGGLHAVFLRDGMTSQDTLGYGATADLGLGPTATVNVNIPSEKGIPQPWNARVSSIEGGAGVPGFAATTTYTPQQIADFLTRYILPPPSGPDSKSTFVRDSAAAASVPSRSNVFEYGFPEPGSAQPNAFDTGAPPVPYLPSGSQGKTGGIPGMLAAAMGVDPTNPDQPPPGGLYPLMLEYMRNNPGDNSGR